MLSVLFLIALPPGQVVLISALHHGVIHGLDIHAVLEGLFRGRADTPPASLGPMVIPSRHSQGNEDDSADDTKKDHDLHLTQFVRW